MPFNSCNLSVLAYANGFTLWHYKLENPRDDFFAKGFFNSAADMLGENDMMIITGPKVGALTYAQVNGSAVHLLTWAFVRGYPDAESSALPVNETPEKAVD